MEPEPYFAAAVLRMPLVGPEPLQLQQPYLRIPSQDSLTWPP